MKEPFLELIAKGLAATDRQCPSLYIDIITSANQILLGIH